MRCRRFVLLAAACAMLSAAPRGALGQYRYCPPPCNNCQPYAQSEAARPLEEDSALDESTQPVEMAQQPQQTFTSSANNFTSASNTFAPNMIGDLLGGPAVPVQYDFFGSPYTFGVGSAGSLVAGRIKLSDNNSPLPRDRVFFDYSYFHNVPLASGGINVSRFVPGFEKTFFDGMASVDVRLPMLYTLNDEVTVLGSNVSSDHGTEFGDLATTFKLLLWESDVWAVSGGMGISAPTSDDLLVRQEGLGPLLRIGSNSVHLTPYIAALATPNDLFFVQSFLQLDVDTNGDRVYTRNTLTGELDFAGRYREQTYLYFDVATGVWLYRNDYTRGLSGVAAIFEVHYTQSLENLDVVSSSTSDVQLGANVPGADNNFSLLNFTVGLTAVCGYGKTTTIGYAFPVTGDQVFDGEIRAFINWYF